MEKIIKHVNQFVNVLFQCQIESTQNKFQDLLYFNPSLNELFSVFKAFKSAELSSENYCVVKEPVSG